MMTYQQIGDILNQIRDYHRRFRQALAEIEDSAGFETTETLAEQLQVHEHHWQIALKEYGDDGEEAILNSYIQYVPDDGIQDALKDIRITPAMSTDDVRQLAIRFHSALIDLYATLKAEANAPRVKEFFTRLHRLEQSVTADQAWSSRTP
ncbi:MAG: hypothetical protein R3C59_29285 [Planctomycetaceae bacterium]